MRLEIGSRSYEFQVAGGSLLGDDGRRTAVLCDHRMQRILMSGMVPLPIRAELAALAVSEAWKREVIERPPIKYVGEVS